jgi:outer membrane biosynthesis protein TonB
MREGSIFSGIFHLAVLVLVVVGLPHFRVMPPDPEPVSTVEVVTVAPKATAPHLPKPPAPKPPPDVKPKPDPTPPPPAPPPAAKPDPTPPKPEVIPDKKTEAPKPKPEPVEKKVEAPKPPPPKKVEPKKEPPKPKADPFDSILKNLTKTQPRPTKEPPPKPQPQQAMVPPPPVQGAATLAEQLSRSELDAVRDRIRPCWNFPAGAKDADQLLVEITVSMNPDGRVREARIVDTRRMASDSYFRSAAESALRAVLNPACQPLPLSPEKYNTWKEMTLRFDPRDL